MQYADDVLLSQYQAKADAMKSAVLNASGMNPAAVRGTVYYVRADGDDAADGLTPSTAFRSLERVKNLVLKDGDAVLFRRGDLFRGNSWEVPDGVAVSAWGEGAKPTLCGSSQNYADPALWIQTEHPGIWKCTVPQENVGLITFDHDPKTTGKYDVLCGWLVTPAVDLPPPPDVPGPVHSLYVFPDPPPLQLKNDLEFWTDDKAKTLYLRSSRNPGERFHDIEIAPGKHGILVRDKRDITLDNLHITLFGRHGISGWGNVNFEVKNCVLDYIGGSVLWEQCPFNPAWKFVRFGNAVEVLASCDGFRVHDNWIYQIYDTGITHQSNDTRYDVRMRNVEYWNNLVEYCYWSIEYYNCRNKSNITENIHVHDNFCRFGGDGWGCRLRKHITPMYAVSFDADETRNYVTENNIFQFSRGYIVRVGGRKHDPSGFLFRHNTYIQYEDGWFSWILDDRTPAAGCEKQMRDMFREEDPRLFLVKK